MEGSTKPTLGYNPNRTRDLFALTREDHYIIAQDIACQYEYIDIQRCPECGAALIPIAQINRSFQGLNEIVTVCSRESKNQYSFIFDISNDVYQAWWAEQMGEHYERVFEGSPRTPDPEERFFDE